MTVNAGHGCAALRLAACVGSTEAARAGGLKVAEAEEWRDRFLLGGENALRGRQEFITPYKPEQSSGI